MKKQEGFMLITALLVMGTLAAFGVAFYLTSNTNTLTTLNEIKGEELHFLAESGVRMALSIYKQETGPIEIVSWKDVYNQPEDNFKVLVENPVGSATYVGMYNDSDPNLIKFLGKGIQEKKGKSGEYIVREILVNAKPLSSGPTPTPVPSPNNVINSGHRKATQKLQDAINNAKDGDVIEIVQTSKEDREGGGPIVINKSVHIIGVYKPTNGFSGNETAEPRVLIRKPLIIEASNVTIEGLWIDPVQYEPISSHDSRLEDAERETGCYVESSLNGVTTDNPELNCTEGSNLEVPHHNGAAIIVKSGGNIIIKNNVIGRGKGSYDVGIYVAPGVQGVLIEHNTFVDTENVEERDEKCDYGRVDKNPEEGNTAIVVDNIDRDTYVTVTNNIFAYSKCDYSIGVEVLGKRGENIDENGEELVQCVQNDFWNNTLALGNVEGFGIYEINPGFIDWTKGIFTLSDESPLKKMGFDDEDLGVVYNSPIFRTLTIVNWDNVEYFESLLEALRYATDGEEIRVDKMIPVEIRKNKGENEEEKDIFLTDYPLLEISQNDLHIYSTKGPMEDTRVPLFIDVVGDGINIEGLKFELTDNVLGKLNNVKGDIEGIGVINLGLRPLLQEDPADFYKYHWHHTCWSACMVDCVHNNLSDCNKDHKKGKSHHHHSNCGCVTYCMTHWKDYCEKREGIKFSLSNSIIVRPGEEEFGSVSDPKDYNISGISGGYLEEAILTNVVITSLGKSAYGDGVRFINVSEGCFGKGMCHWCGHHHTFWHYGRGKFVISNSIITGYITQGDSQKGKNSNKGKHGGCGSGCNCGGGSSEGNDKGFDIVGVNASFSDRGCSTSWHLPPCGTHNFSGWSCDSIREDGSCGCGSYNVCVLPFWSPFHHWKEAVSREIVISQSDLWGNTCDIKYEGSKSSWKHKTSEGLSSVDYSNIVGVDPGFVFEGVPENQMFRVGPSLSDCNCGFKMGIDWEKFNK